MKCLGPGEVIVAEWQNGSPTTSSVEFYADGDFPIPEKFSRIHFKKLGGVKPTTVEIMVNV